MDKKTPNLGWLFYKDYYSHLESSFRKEPGKKPKDLPLDLKNKNDVIIGQTLGGYSSAELRSDLTNSSFPATIKYPGLMVGLGAQHSIGHEEEVKLGFTFDHTTGLPYLPASSVKGLLRSYFPSRLRAAASDTKRPESERKALKKKADRLLVLMNRFLFPKSDLSCELSEADLEKLERHIFEGVLPEDGQTHESVYLRDIFFDAFPVSTEYKGSGSKDNGRFIGFGAITPHGANPLKNPIPLRFLKVLPGVVFQFQFRLFDSQVGNVKVSTFHKFQLFQQIITHFGIGAKTNVGYGRVERKT
jgi:CRISPR-associated protein Cmr6